MSTLDSYQDILTVEEAQEVLGIGQASCYEYLRQGVLKSFKIGSKVWKIPKAAIIEFIETNGYTKN